MTTTAASPPELDAYDRAILRILQQDNRTSQREIGSTVHLSAPAVQRRIARLEKAGVIRRNAAVLEPTTLGRHVTMLVEVTLVSDSYRVVEEMKKLYREAPEVQQCYCVAGEAGFILIILVPNIGDYESLTRRLLADNEHVKSYRTAVVLDRVKVGLEIDF